MKLKIALINENSQRKQNKLIHKTLEKVANKYHHEIFNYGATETNNIDIDYVGAGLLTGILLNTKAADFVITGCASGQGLVIMANGFPNVFCGYISDPVDMELFLKINAGNAISIPFGKKLGVGSEINLESIFEKLFTVIPKSGYPSERKEIQEMQRKNLEELKRISHINMLEILEETDKDLLYKIIHNDYFEENFFANSQNDQISEYLKNIIDAWES